eukprot:gene16355-19412_t
MSCRGGNEYLQCGVEASKDQRDFSVPMAILADLKITQVAAGGMHSMALTDEGHVWTWGQPLCDFTNVSQRRPSRLIYPEVGIIKKVAAGAFHNLALREDGIVLSWGRNDYGQLGSGTTKFSSTPTVVPKLEDVKVTNIAASGWHSLILTDRGEVYAWGRGEYGRLGLGEDCSSKLFASKMELPGNDRIVQ